MSDKKEAELKIGELTQREEFGRGIVRIDSNTMQKIGIREGDIVELEGVRKTPAIAVRSYPADAGLNVARMDGLVRRNVGSGVGDTVKIRKADVKEAKRVTLAPAQEGIIVQISPNLIKQNIYYRPLTKGDIIVPTPVVKGRSDMDRTPSIFQDFFGFGFEEFFFTPTGETRFVVTNTEPGGIVRITDMTDLKILPRLPKGFELEKRAVPAVTYEDVGGIHQAIQKVREMIELPLRHPELFCVSADTPILKEDGSIIPAENFYEELKSKNVKRRSGGIEEIIVESGDRVFSFNPETMKIEPTKIKGAVKLKSDKIYRIEGLSFLVKVSENEPFLTIDENGKLFMKKAMDLKEGDYVAVPSGISLENERPQKVKLLDGTNPPQIRFVRIKKIEEVDGDFDLYDFETESNWFIGGFGPVILHNTKLGIEPPKGVLLYGPPGCGKTLLARAVANESGANFYSIAGPEVMSMWYGKSEENLRKIFEEAEKNAPSIIFIDEIDSIAPKREEVHGEVERRVVSQLLTLMDGLKTRGKVIVIAATNVPNIIDPALRRPGRFDREIEIGIPDRKGRKEILEIHTRHMPLAKDVNLDKLADITYGYTGADISALTKEAAMHALRRVLPEIKWKEEGSLPKDALEKLIVNKKDFEKALKLVEPSAMREVLIEVPNVKWSDVGGLEKVKQDLRESVEWPLTMPQNFKRLGITPPKGVLLYGPPGCGKTLLARAVATESNANFISVKGPELFSKWVGESERRVRELFRRAKQVSPAIIFFDEIDAMVPRRGLGYGEHVTEKIVSQMLTELSGLEELHDVIVIAATNRPDMLDPALLRPGRFDRQILVPEPDEKARLKILEIKTKDMPLKGVNLKKLAKQTVDFSGADLDALCREAAMHALRENKKIKEVTMKHFEKALKEAKPSLSKRIVEFYKQFDERFKKKVIEEKEEKEKELGYVG